MSNLDLFNGNGIHTDMRLKTNTALNTLNGDKVEKVSGKGLSEEDYTTADKAKVDSALQAGDNISDLTNNADYIVNNSGVDALEKVSAFPASPVTGTLYFKVV